MDACEVCGNQYDKAFQVRTRDGVHVFDSFECAIQALAPVCRHCSCRIMGHGVEVSDRIYCCAHCARVAGEVGLKDRQIGESVATSRADL
jgi:hypothetical protein